MKITVEVEDLEDGTDAFVFAKMLLRNEYPIGETQEVTIPGHCQLSGHRTEDGAYATRKSLSEAR